MNRLDAADLKKSPMLVDPFAVVVDWLGLGEGALGRTARGLKVRCPGHVEKNASCSVRFGPDGTLQVHCFGCGFGGDVFTLIAAVHGCDFRSALQIAADFVGETGSAPRPPAALRTFARPGHPPGAAELWASCLPVLDEPTVTTWIQSRGLDPTAVQDRDLARALPSGARLSAWAAHGGRSWAESGHRCIVPLFDDCGVLRSLRARCVVSGESPKVLAPRGHTTAGTIMADAGGRALLAGGPASRPDAEPRRVVVSEGDADFLTWATMFSDADESAPAVFGVFSGAWSPQIAARVPDGAMVAVRTDHDIAGEKYAAAIAATLQPRCQVLRGAQ